MDSKMSVGDKKPTCDAFESLFFLADVPNDEDDLQKMLQQEEEHRKTCSDNESSDCDLSEPYIIIARSKPYSKQSYLPNGGDSKSDLLNSNQKSRTYNFIKASKREHNMKRVCNGNSSVADAEKFEALENNKRWQPRVMLTDILDANRGRKNSFMEFKASVPTDTKVEKNEVDKNFRKSVANIRLKLQSKDIRIETSQKSQIDLKAGLLGSVPQTSKRRLSSKLATDSPPKMPKNTSPDLKLESGLDCKSSVPESQEVFKSKPARKPLSFMDMIKRYSEKNTAFEPKTPAQEEISVKSCDGDSVQIVNHSAKNSLTIANFTEVSKLNSDKKLPKVLSPTPSPGKTTDDGKISTDNNLVYSPLKLNGNASSCFSKALNGFTTPKKSLNEAGVNKSSDSDVTPNRMRTRIQTKSLVAINAKDLLSGKICLRNKADYPLTQTKPKISPKNMRSLVSKNKLKSINGQNSAETSTSNNEIIKNDESLAKLSVGNAIERTAEKCSVSDLITDDFSATDCHLPTSNENSAETSTSNNEIIKNDESSAKLSVGNAIERTSAEKCSVSDLITDDFSATDCHLPTSNENELNNVSEDQCKSSDAEKHSIPRTNLPAIDPQPLVAQPQTLLPMSLFVNPFSPFNFASSCTPIPSQGSQVACPVVNQFGVQQFHFSPSITSPILQPQIDVGVNPQFKVQNIFQTAPDVCLGPQSGVQVKDNVNASSFVSKSFVSHPLGMASPVQLQPGSKAGPIIMHNSVSSTRTYASTETVDSVINSKQLKSQGFSFVKSLSESAKNLCLYNMSDFALRFFTEHDSSAKVAVKDFYLCSPLAETISSKISETLSEFDDSPRVEYVFEDDFQHKPLREVVKDYVSFHLEAIYKSPASTEHLIKKAFKYLPFRDCYYLSEVLPKSSEVLNCQDMILYLSCSALLVIYDECKKRNVL